MITLFLLNDSLFRCVFRVFHKSHALLVCEGAQVGAFGQLEVALLVADVRAVTSVKHSQVGVFVKGTEDVVQVFFPFLVDDVNGAFVFEESWVVGLGEAVELAVMSHVWTKTPYGDDNLLALEFAQRAREVEQFQHLFQSDALDAHVLLQSRETRLFF